MFGVASRVLLAVVIICAPVVWASSAVGQTFYTEIIILAITPQRYTISDDLTFQLVDLNRMLRVTTSPRLPHIRDMVLSGYEPSAYILTRQTTADWSSYGLYRFDLTDGDLTALLHQEDNTHNPEYYNATNIYQRFSPSRSPDGSKLAFIDPVDNRLYTHVFATGVTRQISELAFRSENYALSWSPDNQHIAYREPDGTLVILGVDDGSIRQYEQFESGTPYWSPDGRWILLTRWGGTPVPIQLVDPDTGQLNPITKGIVGTSPQWGCDGRWLSYLSLKGQAQTVSYTPAQVIQSAPIQARTLNLETGLSYNLHGDLVLADVSVGSMFWLPGCKWLVLSHNYGDQSFPSLTAYTRFFVVNKTGTEARLLTERGRWRGITVDGTSLMYEALNPDGMSTLYRFNPDDDEPEFLAEYRAMDAWLNITADLSRAVFLDFRSGQMNLLDFDTGTIQVLTPDKEPVYSYLLWQG